MDLQANSPVGYQGSVEIPLVLENGRRAVVRSLDMDGMALDIEGEEPLASPVDFSLELQQGHVRFVARGHVVDSCAAEGRLQAVVRFMQSRLVPCD